MRGLDFARLIASLFLAYDYTVYLFDEAYLYPSVTYAVPTLKADIGVFISASHNDFRYNGYKLSCWNGSQFDPAERAHLYEHYIKTVTFGDIKTLALTEAPQDKLWFLGGEKTSGVRTVQEGELAGLPLADPLPDVSGDHYAEKPIDKGDFASTIMSGRSKNVFTCSTCMVCRSMIRLSRSA